MCHLTKHLDGDEPHETIRQAFVSFVAPPKVLFV